MNTTTAGSGSGNGDGSSFDDSTRVRALPLIGGFRVEKALGEGGMGRVFLATDVSLGRQVAIKMMTAEISNDPEFRARFENEGKIVARFRHPNIVSVHASGEADGFKYIVMECALGGTLSEKLIDGPLPEPQVVFIARQMADALRYSHARGVIHRDFKPGNVLFTEEGVPVLSDFGVARSMARDRTVMTKVGMVIGAMGYMAPEQELGQEITERIDSYSFGLVLLQMCAGALPEGTDRVIRSKQQENRLRQTLVGHSRPLVDLICRCLQWDPADRPSADDCYRALASLDWAASVPFASRRRVELWRRGWFASALVALIIIGGGLAILARQQSSFIDPGSDTLNADFEAIALPSIDEHRRFVDAIEAPGVTPASFRGVSDPVLRTTLELKQLSLSDQRDELLQRQRELENLASRGNAPAALTLYLAAEENYLDRSSADFVPGLEAAAESGYALATWWYAIHLRGALPKDEPVAANDARLLRYCETMRLASRQGLPELANPYLNSDECQGK